MAFNLCFRGTSSVANMIVRSARKTRPRPGLCALVVDKSGNTLIEFAFVVLPTIALILATIETGLTFFARQGLQTTAQTAGRALLTGRQQLARGDLETFKTAICNGLPAYMTCANMFFNVTTSSSFSAAETTPPPIEYDKKGNVANTSNYNTGNAGDIVVVQIYYYWPIVEGPMGFTLSNMSNSRRLLVATSVFKTEPYQ